MEDNSKNNHDSKGETSFGLPGGYFEKSAQTIINKIEWEEEHKSYPHLLKLKGNSAFGVPEDYFLKNEVSLELHDFPKLQKLMRRPGFSTPVDYFDLNEFKIFEELKSEEHNELSSFRNLNSISKQNNFYVPLEYFPSNKAHVTTRLEQAADNKVVSLFRKSVAYSIAAMLLVVISLWVYNYYFRPMEVKDCGTIACVDRVELVNSKSLETLDSDQLYDLVNPGDLERNLNVDTDAEKPAGNPDTGLRDVPMEELLDEI